MSELKPNSELTLEYRFVPYDGLPLVDYVFSCDLSYNLEKDDGSLLEYKTKFLNTTINIYDKSASWKIIDFEFIFMLISIALFWAFVALLFYELWYIPNQIAQGKQPLSTQEQIINIWNVYIKGNYDNAKSKLLNKPITSPHNSSKNKPQKKKNDEGWLSGTSASKKRRNKKNR